VSEYVELPKGMKGSDLTYEMSQPTGALRWAVPAHTTTKPKRLQQQFRVVKHQGSKVVDYRDEWRDVPTEILPPSEPSRP
jgi:hypothetical protein